MKTHRFNLVVGLLLAVALPSFAADLAVTGNLTVSGTIGAVGKIDSADNNFLFGTQGGLDAVSLTYVNNTTDTLQILVNRNPASWVWLHQNAALNATVPAMRLDSNHQLILYNAAGTTAGVTLTPISNQISLGTATLTGSGANLTAGGALTVASGITNTNGSLTGGASGLTLNSGTAATNITLTAAGTGDIVFNTNSLERARIKYTGYVGIGTPGPLTKLDVRGTSATADATVQIVGTGVSTLLLGQDANGGVIRGQGGNGSLRFLVGGTADQAAAGSGSEAMRILSSGNVGIGTATPSRLFEVSANTSVYSKVTSTNSFDAAMQFSASGTDVYVGRMPTSGGGAGTLDFYNGGLRMAITPAGNVGIGTTGPSAKLEVVGGVSAGLNDSMWLSGGAAAYESGPRVVFHNSFGSNPYPTWRLGEVGAVYQSGSTYSGALVFNTNNGTSVTDMSEKMRISYNGNVGIGTTSPANTLELFKSETSSSTIDSVLQLSVNRGTPVGANVYGAAIQFNGSTAGLAYLTDNARIAAYSPDGSDNGYNLGFFTRPNASNNSQERLTINRAGNVGIGTTSPTHKLSVKGAIRAQEIIVDNTGWADYVFDSNYRLAPLSEVESHIKAEKHLPGIPSAAEIAEHGVSMGDMQSKLLSKIEELTLHMIRIEKENSALRSRVQKLEATVTTP